ncbi:MAG: signal peptidase I [Clostridiales bacterium]|nr:signal peptidase I [Clostridiales bacterium]
MAENAENQEEALDQGEVLDNEEAADQGDGGNGKGKKHSALREALSWIITIAAAIAIAMVLKNFVIINATVPTGSMEHTIEPGDDILGFRLSYVNSEPQRGDIIIFRFPDDESQKYVKRIIGLPGETVRIEDAKIYIDGSDTPLTEDYLKEEWVWMTGPFEFEVPEGCYLVLGDNRNDSYDARYWTNTYVRKDQIIGKAYITYYPFSRAGSLYK